MLSHNSWLKHEPHIEGHHGSGGQRSAVVGRFAVLVLATALLNTSCASSLFKVKPVVELPPLSGNIKTASAGGVSIRVAPLMSDEESQELFESNLPLGGVLPLRMELVSKVGWQLK